MVTAVKYTDHSHSCEILFVVMEVNKMTESQYKIDLKVDYYDVG